LDYEVASGDECYHTYSKPDMLLSSVSNVVGPRIRLTVSTILKSFGIKTWVIGRQ
jgi:hypothetical protein